MPLRLIQITVPPERSADVDGILENAVPVGRWKLTAPDGGELIQFVLPVERVEALMDRFSDEFDGDESFRVTLLAVEAALPEPDENDDEDEADDEASSGPERVSRVELMADAMESARLTPVFLAMVAASTVVAVVGVLRDDVAVIIGAMVIAPLLGPNVALALAATLADADLARRAIVTNLAGVACALLIAVAAGALLTVDPTVEAIATRTRPSVSDMALALAAGTAGTLAFSSGLPQAVIGVMVAVALLPPLVIFGLLLGAGLPGYAAGAFILVALNVVCLNLAGVGTFLARGVRPAGWWEAEKARKSVRWAVLTWTVLLLGLAVILWLARRQGLGPFSS